MFHIVENVRKRPIISDISVEEFVSAMKFPDSIRKSQILNARKLSKSDKKYTQIKQSLPCIVFNYRHDSYVNGETRIASTGFVYIDIDDYCDIDYSKFNFIVAAWKSLSGVGKGLLCSVENVGLDDYKEVTDELANLIGVPNDNKAISKDRLCVLGFDENIYYNPNYSKFRYRKEYSKLPIEKSTIPNIYKTLNKDVTNCTFLKNKIRFSNLEELTNNIDFDGEAYYDYEDKKIGYAEVIIPNKVLEGKRNSIMFSIASQFIGLNPWIDYELFVKWMSVINRDRFKPILDADEFYEIINKVFNKDKKEFIINKKRRMFYNPDYKFSTKEKRAILNKAIGEHKIKLKLEKLTKILDNWDFENLGKITQVKIADISGLHINTIKNSYNEIKIRVNEMNLKYKKLHIK